MKRTRVLEVLASMVSVSNPVLKKSEIVKKLCELGVSRATAYRSYNDFVKLNRGKPLQTIGRPKIRLTPAMKRKILKKCDGKIFPGYRRIARLLKVNEHAAKRLVQESGIIVKSRKKKPKVSEEQAQRQKTRIRKLRYQSSDRVLVLDDETYFDIEGHNFFGGKRYSFASIENISNNVKFFEKSKFSAKLMVWIAISEAGHSVPYFHLSKGAINKNIYINECLKKRLIPFLRKVHPDENILFWPDLASCHYAKDTIRFIEENNIPFVNKGNNPPNVPELRPIETFWSHLKSKVYRDGYSAKNTKVLIKRIKSCLKTFDKPYFYRLLHNLREKLLKADSNGIMSFY